MEHLGDPGTPPPDPATDAYGLGDPGTPPAPPPGSLEALGDPGTPPPDPPTDAYGLGDPGTPPPPPPIDPEESDQNQSFTFHGARNGENNSVPVKPKVTRAAPPVPSRPPAPPRPNGGHRESSA